MTSNKYWRIWIGLNHLSHRLHHVFSQVRVSFIESAVNLTCILIWVFLLINFDVWVPVWHPICTSERYDNLLVLLAVTNVTKILFPFLMKFDDILKLRRIIASAPASPIHYRVILAIACSSIVYSFTRYLNWVITLCDADQAPKDNKVN